MPVATPTQSNNYYQNLECVDIYDQGETIWCALSFAINLVGGLILKIRV